MPNLKEAQEWMANSYTKVCLQVASEAELDEIYTKAEKAGLTVHMIIDSGRGIHCYWPFIEPVDKAVWTPVAEGLKFLCAKHGLKADGACTADAARILRVPNTKNFKDINKPEDVKILMEGKATDFDTLASLIPIHVSNKPKAKRPLDPATKAILGNNSAKFKKIVDKCHKNTQFLNALIVKKSIVMIEKPGIQKRYVILAL